MFFMASTLVLVTIFFLAHLRVVGNGGEDCVRQLDEHGSLTNWGFSHNITKIQIAKLLILLIQRLRVLGV